jgi:predicted acylesterase/phospholipase RssA
MEAWLWCSRNSDARLADIVDASSAAPTFFPPVKIEKEYAILLVLSCQTLHLFDFVTTNMLVIMSMAE